MKEALRVRRFSSDKEGIGAVKELKKTFETLESVP
jgi:hypothetical protein